MKCKICGRETPQLSNRQKYCPECAWQALKETQKRWRETHSTGVKQRYCPDCGKLLEPGRNVCDECLKERRRKYQREYHRKIRAVLRAQKKASAIGA